MEIDKNFDGNIDEWQYYENKKLIKAEFDLDYDGVIDKVQEYWSLRESHLKLKSGSIISMEKYITRKSRFSDYLISENGLDRAGYVKWILSYGSNC